MDTRDKILSLSSQLTETNMKLLEQLGKMNAKDQSVYAPKVSAMINSSTELIKQITKPLR